MALHGTLPLLGSWSLSVTIERDSKETAAALGARAFRLHLTQALSVTLSAPVKQKEETIRELAVLPTFQFSVLDTLVQPLDCSNLCQLARAPRRQPVSECSYRTTRYLHFSVCHDVSALPMMGGLVVRGTFTLTPMKECFSRLG